MKFSSLLMFLLLLFSCNSKENTKQLIKYTQKDSLSRKEILYVPDKEDYYKNQVFSKKLKGGYEVYYTINKDYKSIYLRHDSVRLKLNSLPVDVGTFYSLGIILNDFDKYFTLGHDQGNSAPYLIELIEKRTAKNLLEHQVVSIEGKYNDDYLVYYDDSVEALKNKVVLFDLKLKRKEYFNFPGDFYLSNINRSYIFIDTLSQYQISVSYEVDSGTLKKEYKRY